MKKTMKVMMAMIIATIILFVAVPSTYANGETNFSVILTANKIAVKKGETVEVTIGLSEFSNVGKGINSFLADLEYDTTKLSIESSQIVAQNGWDTPTYENNKLLTAKGSMVTTNEEIIKMTFTVNAETELGTTTIIVKNAEAANDENDFVGLEGTINIEIVEDSTGDEGTGDEGTGDEGTGDEGTGDEGTGGEGTGDEECIHTYEVKNDGTHHWEECSKCKEKKADTKKSHTYGEYKDNGNGTHSATCTVCNYKLVENHNTNGPTCKYCNAANSSSDNNSNNNNNGDKTTVDKEIPKAGASVLLVTGMIAVVAIAIVMYKKNQKYQDIK